MGDQSDHFIGAAIYRRGNKTGTLDADWVRTIGPIETICKGRATGGPANGFVGTYAITYQNEQGRPSKTYDLRIDRKGEVFHLSWWLDGRQIYEGIGLPFEDAIAFGWGPKR